MYDISVLVTQFRVLKCRARGFHSKLMAEGVHGLDGLSHPLLNHVLGWPTAMNSEIDIPLAQLEKRSA